MDDIVDLVRRSLADETDGEFTDRVDAQAEALRRAIAAGEFDNEGFSVGLEVELYAINSVPTPPRADEQPADDLGGDRSGGDGGNAWDWSLDPRAEPGASGASLEPDGETPPPDGN